MSEKIIVKLRRDNISVSSCKEGVYLTFDAENARPIICKYSEVITIFTPNQIYDVEDIMLMLGPVLHSFLEKAKISTGLLHWESANPFVKLRSRAVKDYVLILNEIRKIAIEDDLKAIIISLDDIRQKIGKNRQDHSNEGEVVRKAKIDLKTALNAKKKIVYDATNLRRDFRDKIIGLSSDYHALTEVVLLTDTLSNIYKRDNDREYSVGKKVLDYQHTRFEYPEHDEADKHKIVFGS